MDISKKLEADEFDAFISYSSEDNAFAEKLERALEQFRPPRPLPVPKRHLRVFRYEADMTGVEYNESVEKKLKSSSKLIIVCSPNARSSRFVDGEIRVFADKSRGSKHMIPILLDGLPNNEAGPDQADRMAFPEALCEKLKMPLATSYVGFSDRSDRVDGGKFEDSWYKLLANLYGISREEVEQRERRRRRNRKLGLTMAVASVILAASALVRVAWIAELQRHLALSRELADEAISLLDSDFDTALLLSLEANRVSQTFEARNALARGLFRQPEIIKVLHPTDKIVAIATHPKKNLFVLSTVQATGDSELIFWDLSEQKTILHGRVPIPLRKVVFSQNGEFLATASSDQVLVWQVSPILVHVATFHMGNSPTYSTPFVAFSLDGKTLAAEIDHGKIFLWDVPKRKALCTPYLKSSEDVTGLGFMPDGTLFSLAGYEGEGTFSSWDISTCSQKDINLVKGWLPNPRFFALSPEGKFIATGGEDGIALVETKTFSRVGEPLMFEPDHIDISFEPDNILLVASGKRVIRNWVIELIEEEPGEESPPGLPRALTMPFDNQLLGHTAPVIGLGISADSRSLVSIGEDQKVVIWNLDSDLTWAQRLETQEFVKDLTFSDVGGRLTSASSGTTITNWSLDRNHRSWQQVDTGKKLFDDSNSSVVNQVFLSPQADILITINKDNISVFYIASGRRRDLSLKGSAVTFDHSGRTAVLFGDDRKNLVILDTRTLQHRRMPVSDTPIDVHAITFHPNGELVAFAPSARIHLIDVSKGELLFPAFEDHAGSVNALAFSPDNNLLASGGYDNTIFLWNVNNRTRYAGPLHAHNGYIEDLKFRPPDGRMLASVGADDKIILWDVETARPYAPLHAPDGCSRLAFSPDGKRLACNSHKDIIVWQLDFDSWKTIACRKANRNLTQEEWVQYFSDEPYRRTCPELPSPTDAKSLYSIEQE